MTFFKNSSKNRFPSFIYFYKALRYRIFFVLIFSLLIGLLDGLGLTMFLPLLQLVNDSSAGVESEALGKLGFIIDFFQNVGISITLVSILVFMAFFFIAKGIMQYFATFYRVKVQQWFIKSLRLRNIALLNGIEYKYFVKTDVGRVQNLLTGEISRVASAFVNYFTAVQYGIMILIYMCFAFAIDAQFAVLVTIGGVLTNFIYKNLYTNTKKYSRSLTQDSNIFQSLVIQNVSNYKYLKATGTLSKYREKLDNSTIQIEEINTKIGKLDAILNSGREPILIIVVVSVIYIQTVFFDSNLGSILISLIFFYRALGYLMQFQIRWNKFLSFSGSMENITLFEKELSENQEKETPDIKVGKINNLQLKNVSFSYDEQHVLKNISLNISEKEVVAFVGESGSGKTTIVNILSNLLSINQGEYLINGEPFTNFSRTSFQNKIGYITQDPVIFNDTLYNNVSLWEENSSKNISRFWEVIEQASLSEFVNDLPQKENTVLGHSGQNLSGGQKQRISIARELFKNVELLILDEATSALDSETERAIQENIDKLKGQKTILMVAHRLSTIKNADKIVVLRNGEIEHVGNFKTLLSKSNYFKNLVELQEV